MTQAQLLRASGSALVGCSLLFAASSSSAQEARPLSPVHHLQRLEDLTRLLRFHYVDPERADSIAASLLDQLLSSLDPHTFVLDVEEARAFDQEMYGSNTLHALGIDLNRVRDTLRVFRVIPGTPAARAGVLPNDRLVSVSGKPTLTLTADQVADLLAPESDQKISLIFYRPSARKKIGCKLAYVRRDSESVANGFLLNGRTGYLRLESFTADAARQTYFELEQLESRGMRELVLDLRENGGGMLDAAVLLADIFLPGSKTVTTLRGRGRDEVLASYKASKFESLPLVILVDGNSASASEVFAAAMQDHDRAIIVGRPTFGKGLVQRQFPLGNGCAFRITTSRWYAPSGRWIQKAYCGAEYDADTLLRNASGDNRKHALEFASDSGQLRARHSDSGKALVERHGVIPDVLTPPSQPSRFMSRMHDRNVFHDAIDDYLDTEAQSFYATYKDADPRSIAISPMLRSLLLVKARQAGMRVMTDELAVDSANCDRRLRASLAYRFFGIGAWHRVYRERDQDLEAAIEQLEAARAMAEAQGVN